MIEEKVEKDKIESTEAKLKADKAQDLAQIGINAGWYNERAYSGPDFDPLEHRKYGEAHTEDSSHENSVPNPLYKPLTITNALDKHDFTPPNKLNWWG